MLLLKIYPIGNFFIPLHSLAVTYAIFKNQFHDIKFVYNKGLTYSFLLTIVSIFYLIIVIILEKYLQTTLGYTTIWFSIITAFVVGILFIPLRNNIQRLVDRYFFKSSPEEIALQNERLRKEVLLTDKYKTISTLASGMAHEIKNPLTAILTFCEKLPENLKNEEFLNKFSRIITRESHRINDLVNDLLDYGKPTPPQLKPTNINKLIHDTAEFLNNQCVANKIQIELNLSSQTDVDVMIDPKQIRQALLNILLNAIDAMPGGGNLAVGVRVKGLGDSNLSKPYTPNPIPSIEISIADTGSGIDPKDLPHIFDPFFSKKDNGTGLGLAITQGIIENHGGKIRVKSSLGKGTEFTLLLPLADQRQQTIDQTKDNRL